MIKKLINRIDNWYNSRSGDKQVYLFFSFCLLFLVLLGLSIRFMDFSPTLKQIPLPQHIGQASGLNYRDSLTHKKK